MRLLPLLIVLLVCRVQAAFAAPSAESLPYAYELIARAERAGLDRDRYWRILLHDKEGAFGVESVVDDPAFFTSPEGKRDPRAELRSTILSFFEPALLDTTGGKQHPVCRFAARFEWLKEKLEIDESRLPVPRCERLDSLMAGIRPESATLIFPTAHMNSPASMYGHTLLIVETATKSKLLAYAVNFSALTKGSSFAPIYMAKGLFGGYPGYFSILPYYAKLQEYSDVNDRDIWEYPLDLTREEVERLVAHIYELQGIYSDYYFFGENCSYGILFLLEAARPSAHLTDRFGWWVIPLDTIRAARECGLVHDAIYRPSSSTKVQYLASLLSRDEREAAWKLARGEGEPADLLACSDSKETKARITDLSAQYLQYNYAKGKLTQEEYVPRFLKTLEARSHLGITGEWRDSIPAPPRPDDGHRSNRLALGFGLSGKRAFQEIRIRPAYHDLADDERGFKRGSGIVFADVVLRADAAREKVTLDALDLIDIVSLAPRTRFFAHRSWRIETGFVRPEHGPFAARLAGGLGAAYDSPRLALRYALLEADILAGGAIDGRVSLGAGPSAGWIKERGRWRLWAEGRWLRYGIGEPATRYEIDVTQGIRLGTNQRLSLTYTRSGTDGASRNEYRTSLGIYF